MTFLFKLTSVAGEIWHEHERPLALGIMLLAERLGRLSDARSRAFDAAEARLKLCERLPYPLNHDTAKAVDAALRHRVVTWTQFDEDGYLQDWVSSAYAHEGKQRLPFLSSLLQKGEQSASSAPDREEVKARFAGEAAFEQFLAAEDYSYGLADVPDAAFEARYDLVDEGIRDLVASGKVRAGKAVYLETVPTPLLRDAPWWMVAGSTPTWWSWPSGVRCSCGRAMCSTTPATRVPSPRSASGGGSRATG